jgi:hypothetical protein
MLTYTQYSWTEAAKEVAQQLRSNFGFIHRGVLPVRLVDDSTVPPSFVVDAPMVLGIFGNDVFMWDDKTCQEIELIRKGIAETEGTEKAFGLSANGQTWVFLVAIDRERYQTGVGRTFQKELLKLSLQDIVANAGRQVRGAATSFLVK